MQKVSDQVISSAKAPTRKNLNVQGKGGFGREEFKLLSLGKFCKWQDGLIGENENRVSDEDVGYGNRVTPSSRGLCGGASVTTRARDFGCGSLLLSSRYKRD